MPISNRHRVTPTAPTTRSPARVVTGGTHQRYVRDRRSRPRSTELLGAIAQLDATVDPQAQQELVAWISDFYDEHQAGELVGFFGRCWLGHPFVDHRVGLNGSIVEHFTADDVLPPEYLACRPLARSDAYLFIEVYSDGQVVPIRTDGTPAV